MNHDASGVTSKTLTLWDNVALKARSEDSAFGNGRIDLSSILLPFTIMKFNRDMTAEGVLMELDGLGYRLPSHIEAACFRERCPKHLLYQNTFVLTGYSDESNRILTVRLRELSTPIWRDRNEVFEEDAYFLVIPVSNDWLTIAADTHQSPA